MKLPNLVEITPEKFDVIFDLRYATKNNACFQELYSSPFCFLHEAAIEPFKKAIAAAKNLGLKIKIWDAFRPFEIQKFMFKQFANDPSKDGFISNPDGGITPHCRGVAIDLTLIDENGKELEMGTDFDEFSNLAFHDSHEISAEAQRNRLILLGIMTVAGWDLYSKEWWHYQLPNPREYPIVKSPVEMIAVSL
jgi:D-alanyl-D-alanine dipeptidase